MCVYVHVSVLFTQVDFLLLIIMSFGKNNKPLENPVFHLTCAKPLQSGVEMKSLQLV